MVSGTGSFRPLPLACLPKALIVFNLCAVIG
jgi:hypothetical protein